MKSEYRLYGKETERLSSSLTIDEHELLEEYLEHCAMTAGPAKVATYRRYMLQFRDVLEKPFSDVTRQEIVRFWALVNHSAYELNTKVMIYRTVKRFLRWHFKDPAMLEGLSLVRPAVNQKKVNKGALLTPKEVEAMARAATTTRNRVLIGVLYESAARPQEIGNLRWTDVEWDQGGVLLYSAKTKTSRFIPLNEGMSLLRRWHGDWCLPDVSSEDYVFPGRRGSMIDRTRGVTTQRIGTLVANTAKRAGIRRRVWPYLLRHTRLTEIYTLGVTGITHNIFAGHTPGSRSQTVYVHMDAESVRSEILEKVFKRTQRSLDDSRGDELGRLKREIAHVREENKKVLRLIKHVLRTHDQSAHR